MLWVGIKESKGRKLVKTERKYQQERLRFIRACRLEAWELTSLEIAIKR